MEVRNLTLPQAAKLLNDGAVTSVGLCQAYLERIAEVEPSVQALLSLNKEAESLGRAPCSREGAWAVRRNSGYGQGQYRGEGISLHLRLKDSQGFCFPV